MFTPGVLCRWLVWVTNAPRVVRFALRSLLPRWGLAHRGTAVWLKAGGAGATATPLDSAHRRPYEICIVCAAARGGDGAGAADGGADGGADGAPPDG
eukprot:gene18040-2858_t